MQALPSSYRDTDGFVFEHGGKIFRFIHPQYNVHYEQLMASGLYEELILKGWLIAHEEITNDAAFHLPPGKVIFPQQIPFISYPYEWCFDMWKDAALLTLNIAWTALQKGMLLKDASPFNIQWLNGKPVFIDTLSFQIYEEGKPWIAYRQFCESFLAPLLLMHYCHPDTNRLFAIFSNGIPLDVLTRLLPGKSRWSLHAYLHVHLQAKITGRRKDGKEKANSFSKKKLEILLKGLLGFVHKLSLKKLSSAWDSYYSNTILGADYLKAKTALVNSFLADIEFKSAVDLGANDGYFSLLLQQQNKHVIAIDADANCINELYLSIKKNNVSRVLPLTTNLLSPSPAIGWNNKERPSLAERLQADLVMALALVHHLSISGNIPFSLLADWLKPMGTYLLIEFIPKEDEKVQQLLQNRKDIFSDYSLTTFKQVFSQHYDEFREEEIAGTKRVLLLLKRK